MSWIRSNRPDGPTVSEVILGAFPDSRPDTLAALWDSGRITAFAAGDTIFDQGDDDRLMLVLDGYVGFRRTTIDGRQLIMRIATRGELGPTLPLAARPSGSAIVALSEGEVVVWRAAKARALAGNDPGFAVAIIDHVLASFETAVERVDGLLYQEAITRVARVIYAHRDLFSSDPPVLTRAHLPALVGTSREMTSRVLRILEARGLIARIGRDQLLIVAPERLEQAVIGPSGIRPRDVRNRFAALPGGRMPEIGEIQYAPGVPAHRPYGLPAPVPTIESSVRDFLDASPNPIVGFDSDGAIVFANPRLDAAFGYERDQLLGRPVEVLLTGDGTQRHDPDQPSFLAGATARPFGLGVELSGRRKDGTAFPVEVSLSPIETAEGTVVVATVVDISVRKHLERAEADRHGSTGGPRPATETLVLVDDEPEARQTTAAFIERAGYRVISLADGQAAIDALTAESGPIDLLIADVVMPGVSGLDLAEAVIERDPRVGLVLLSRYGTETLDLARIKAHSALFVARSRTSRDLLDAIQRAASTGTRA